MKRWIRRLCGCKCEGLKEERQRLQVLYNGAHQENARLRAEIERLNRALDLR